MTKRVLYRVIWVPSVMVLAGLIVFFAQQPTALPTPAPPTTFTTSDKTITVSHPGNWQPLEGSMHAVKTKVKFEPTKNVRVVIETDLAGSLIGDISKASSNMLSNLPGIGQQLAAKQKTPLETVHELQAKELKESYEGFQDGATTKAKVAGLEALVTDFTFQERGVWGRREMAGKRVSALASERRLSIVCHYSKDAQEQMAPVIAQMLSSLQVRPTGG
ncbi:MAG: hypothetical protein NZT92_22440 [Abditibacteriales bacterium]|nr:hypothetical protein [Abditibacteriales bacterium]MDW8368410.1 hypothetical protein [Abditibacteriales bacterium]